MLELVISSTGPYIMALLLWTGFSQSTALTTPCHRTLSSVRERIITGISTLKSPAFCSFTVPRTRKSPSWVMTIKGRGSPVWGLVSPLALTSLT